MADITGVLQEYVATANNPEYGGDWDVINSKFPELKDFDPSVLEEYVATANNPDYGENWNIINGKFPEFQQKKEEDFPTGEEVKEETPPADVPVEGEDTASNGEGDSTESQETEEEVVEDGSWKTDENLTDEEIVQRDNDFISAWKEINTDSEITDESLVKEKKKEENKKNAEPTPDVDTSNSLLAPYLKDEEQLIAEPSSTAVPQPVTIDPEEDKKRLEVKEVNNKAAVNFENYKKKNPKDFKPVYTDQGLTTVFNYEDYVDKNGKVIKVGSEEYEAINSLRNDLASGKISNEDYENELREIGRPLVDKMNQDLTFDYIKNNKEIQDVIIPSLYKDNQKAIENKIQELKSKYGDGVNFHTKEDYEEAQSDLNEFVSGFLFDHPRYKELVTNYSNSINELHLKDNNAYTVDKHTLDWIQSLEYAHDNTALSPISPISLYNTIKGMQTGMKSQLTKVQMKYDWSERHKRFERNKQKALKDGWTDETTGFVNEQGDFKKMLSKRDDYRTPTTWGEAKKKMQGILVDNQKTAQEDLMAVMNERAIQGAFKKADFNKFASGEHSLHELSLMASEQVPNMVAALISAGTIPALTEGASVYETLVMDAARKKYGLGENENPTSEQMYAVLMADTENKMADTATLTGGVIGALEFIGAKAAKPVFGKAAGALLAGQYKLALKASINSGQRMALGGFGEGLTEGLQTVASSAATGHWSGDEFVQAIGMGTTIGVLMPFSGSVVTQTKRELSQSIKMVASKYDSRIANKMFDNHQALLDNALETEQISKEEHREKTEALNSVRNSSKKIPKNLNEKEKTEALDLLIEKETLEKEVEDKDKNLVVKQTKRIEVIDAKLQKISTEAQLKSVKKIAEQVNEKGDVKVNITTGNTKAQKKWLVKMEKAKRNAGKLSSKIMNVLKGQAANYGSMIPVLNKNGDIVSYDLFINEETSFQDGMLNTSAHEMFHAMIYGTLKQDNNAQMAMGNGLLSAFQTEGVKVKEGSTLWGRIMQYSKEEGRGEEVLALTSEAALNNELEINETGFDILGNVIRRFSQKHLGVLGGIRFNTNKDILNFIKDYNKSIEDGAGLNKAMLNVLTKGAKGKIIKNANKKGDKTMSSKSGFTDDEIVNDLGLKTTTADIVAKNNEIEAQILKDNVRDENGNVIASPAMQRKLAANNLPRAFALARQAANKGNDLTLEEGLKMNDVMEFFSEYSLKLTELARTYKAQMIDPKTGNIIKVPFGAYMNSLLPLKYSGILDKLKSKVETSSMSDEATAKTVAKKFASNTELSNTEVEGKTVALNSIKENEVQKQLVKIAKGIESLGNIRKYKEVKQELTAHQKFVGIKNDKGEVVKKIKITPEYKAEQKALEETAIKRYKRSGLSEKDAKKKAKEKYGVKELKSLREPTGKLYGGLEAVADIFGKDIAIRILREQDLTTEQRKSAQDKILQYTPEIIAMMPFGTTASGDATGIANTTLSIFFEKLARTAMKNTGTGKGLATQQKQNINPTKFRELVGLVAKARVNNTSVDGAIRAIIVQVAAIANNQSIRQTHGPQTLSLKDGKASTMWSKRFKGDGTVAGDMSAIMLEENVDYKKLLQSKIDALVKDGLMTKKEANEIYGPIDMNSETGRADMENWVFTGLSNYMPWSFFNHTGNWTGTFKVLGKDGKAIKEWNAIRDNVSNDSFKKPYADLTNAQKESVKVKMAKANLPGEVTSKKHKGNLLYKDAVELKEAQQRFIDSGAAWNGENLSEQDKVDIANALKRIPQSEKNLKDEEAKASKKRGVKLIWEIFDQMVEDNPANLKYIAALLSSSASQQGHFMRTGSDFAFLNTMAGENVEEHTQAATAFGRFLFSRMAEGSLSENIDVALESYFQGSLPKIFDNRLKGVNWSYQTDAGRYTWEVLTGQANIWIRYFNPDVNGNQGGIDPNVIVLANGNTLAQEYGVHIDGVVSPAMLKLQQETLFRVFSGDMDVQDAALTMEAMSRVKIKKDSDKTVVLAKAGKQARTYASKPIKGITVLDFDDTLATSKSMIRYTKPDGSKGTLNAEQYASTYQELSDKGYVWDFSEFNEVVGGKIAPLFQKALKLQKKFGPENMFVLTARPELAQQAIFDFLQANGLNIPIGNITGLGNSTGEAKAMWIAGKVGEGYNDFYFADDALQNVEAVQSMLDQLDVKSKVQQARIQFSKRMGTEFNNILEGSTGVLSQKQFSDAQARLRGQKTKYKSIIPASAQDFQGLLYSFLSKGKKGEQDMAFFKKALIDPFAKGYNALNASRQSAANDFENLNKKFPDVKKKLNDNIEGLDYTYDQAARVYLWNKVGFEVPGLSQRDLAALLEVVESSPSLKAYADTIGLISKKEDGYSQPKDYWLAESIASDLLSDGAIGDKRSDFLAEWIENKNMIFSPENLNKIEAIYGSKFREALEDILYRMETGRNRPMGGGRLVNGFMNWTNNSVGAIMFLNLRSATLQTISAVNYVNWDDNNPAKAAAAFANQPQFWRDFSYIFNSDYLKQRRSGNQRGVNEAELSEAVAGSDNKAKAAIAWLLKKGFTPTQIADSFAISMGGATFYRNRIKKYVKEGMTTEQAEKQAFLDLQETTEVNQQSARPDMISQQQASPLGRLILAFQNTPMQYARIMNKATRDLANGRGDYRAHVSKIVYYGFVQSVIFGALQSALYASLGDDDEEDFDRKKERILNQMVDSWLTGIGYGGKAIGTIKNTLMEYFEQRDKGFNSDHAYTLLTLLSFSPPIGSKLRKIYSSIQTEQFNRGVFTKRGFTLDNPIWSGVGNVVEGLTNIPLGRISNLMLQLDNAMDPAHKWWQRVALLLGQNTWDLGIKDPDIEAAKNEVKEEKKVKNKEKQKIKKEQKKKEVEEENKVVIEENKKKSKKDGVCSAVSKGGKRCKTKVVEGKLFCTVHESTTKRSDGKEVQCRKRKSDNKRCKMKTTNKSGYCYYHD